MSGWLKHAGGVGRLIELRGPWRHQSPRARCILEASKLFIIIDFLIGRKCCFLSSDCWKTIPWAREPEAKTSLSYLHDILSDVPGLIENADTLQFSNMAPCDLLYRHNLVLQNLATIWTTLYQWRVSWQLQNPASIWYVPSAMDESPFPVVFHFSSLGHANEINLYHAILLLIIKIDFQVGSSSSPFFSPLHSPRGIDYHSHISPNLGLEMRSVAVEICKSVEYQLCKERRSGGTLYLLFPLRLAWQTFEPNSIEAIWIQMIMGMAADSTAIEISRRWTGDVVI